LGIENRGRAPEGAGAHFSLLNFGFSPYKGGDEAARQSLARIAADPERGSEL
jgi:hypothetical protein